MRRSAFHQMCRWKEASHGRSALLLKGAPGVGKSHLVRAFAETQYRSHLVVDFARADDDIQGLFLHSLRDLDTFFLYLSEVCQTKLYRRDSLILLENVQHFPRARSALKYLVADGRYDYLETGTLLSIPEHVHDILIPSEEHTLDLHQRAMDNLWQCIS